MMVALVRITSDLCNDTSLVSRLVLDISEIINSYNKKKENYINKIILC